MPQLTLAEVSDALLRIAARAEALDTPAGLSTARAALIDAARLNGLIAPAAGEAAPSDPDARRARLAELEARRGAVECE